MKVRFSKPAQADLIRIHGYINKADPEAASRVVTRLFETALSLGDLPEQGRQTDEPGVQVIVVPQIRYFIFYTIADGQVHVVHVRHTSRSRSWLRPRR